MHEAFVHEMKQRLVAEHAALEAEILRLQALTGTDDAFSEHAGLGNHMADDASEMFEREQLLSQQRDAVAHLAQVGEALRRIALGTYGRCENCGGPIDLARLEALPHCSLCMTCKARQEKA